MAGMENAEKGYHQEDHMLLKETNLMMAEEVYSLESEKRKEKVGQASSHLLVGQEEDQKV